MNSESTKLALPIDAVLPALDEALSRGHALLQAPTGSGKSTGVPLRLMGSNWLGGQRILMLEPRRPAARMTAARMASVLGEPLGERVGYQVRFDRRIGPRTRIEVVTEGILTRRIQSDPALEGVGLLIFDEFHERNLTSDLGLTLALDAATNLRPDLKLLVMSATLDAEPVARLLGGAPTLRGEGRSFPVEIRYADRQPDPDPVAAVLAGIRHALRTEDGDILVFLPGAREIDRCVEQLKDAVDSTTSILPLHGSLPTQAQDLALLPSTPDTRRVIVATDIAETSVTIQGVRVVVDSGLTRKPRFDPGSGLERLVTEPVPIASADQRAGRAGRVAPGICYRLWTRAQEHGRPAHRTPEILQSDLAPLVVELALWGVKDPNALAWLDPPPASAWEQAVALLKDLGILDARDALTRLGRAMAPLPLHPRLAAMLLGAAPQARQTAADLCALLTERDPMTYRPDQGRQSDLDLRLRALQQGRAKVRISGMDANRLGAIERVSRQLLGLIKDASPNLSEPSGIRSPGALLALAYPDRIAQRREGSDDRYLLASGGGAVLPRDDALAVHPYLVVAALDARGRDGRIQLALPIDASELRTLFDSRIDRTQEIFWDSTRDAVVARETEQLGAIQLASRPLALNDGEATVRLLLERIREQPERAFAWTDSARQIQARVGLMRQIDQNGDWPDLSLEGLLERLDEWLAPWIVGRSRLTEIQRLDLSEILLSQLSWEQRQRLDREAPRTLTTPAGNQRPLDYVSGEVPVLAVPLQELFGLEDTPRLCNGRVPVLLHLLSPARRPIQVTQDLAGFWARGYAEVRKELRGRYPKHQWPEDPTEAQAMVGGIRRKRPPDAKR
ncbi:ATP-dependent helicase HrpB [Thiorhodococcus drewsii AZ1]|uniref:ATP-dependent helicase HrpB n=1 Tax=Thiorhodococcus drewsii AZ1 TaxID=765913 RepID=G2E3S4_9GAMM|nr:ATP-dependent helicase HrpB [Thiorhodococcus drewsii]EGV30016.1 ATP-dependent helicase HrpB [Thiorhodococcus drewsii AZ1]